METLFSREMLANCVAPVNEVEKAKLHGKRIISKGVDGKITAYLWNDKIYVVAIEIIPETCKHRNRVVDRVQWQSLAMLRLWG